MMEKAPLSRRIAVMLLILLTAYTVQSLMIMRVKSPVTDAVSFHLVNGYSYLKTHDFRMSPATPPLARELMALPWLLMNPELNTETDAWREADSVPFANQVFYTDNREIAPRLLKASRVSVLFLGCLLLWAVFAWTRYLYGASAGVFAVFLGVFSPTFVGYSSIANVEISIALFYFLTMYCLYRFHNDMARRGFYWGAAICLGLAMTSKYTGVLLLPPILFLCVRKQGWRGITAFAGIVCVALLTVWATYFFEFKPMLAGGVPRVAEKLGYVEKISDTLFFGSEAASRILKDASMRMPVPLASWILGFMGIARSHQADYKHFFMGQWTADQAWYHYLFSFSVKVTIAFLVLILIRFLFVRIRDFEKKPEADDKLAPGYYLLLSPAILFFMTTVDTTGVGIRYLIPVFPLFWVWIASLWPRAKKPLMRLMLILLLFFHAAAGLIRFPHYIAYFNEFAGGPAGAYRYLRANDLDWSQGYQSLALYLKREGIENARIRLLGGTDPEFYGMKVIQVTDEELLKPRMGAVYAISAVNLEKFDWTVAHEPKTVIDHVIWIYDFRLESGFRT